MSFSFQHSSTLMNKSSSFQPQQQQQSQSQQRLFQPQQPQQQQQQQSSFQLQQPQQQQQQQPPPPVDPKLMQQLQLLSEMIDPNSQYYLFRHAFYNVSPAASAAASFQPPANIPQELWQQALNSNPQPSRLLPVFANGFEDLKSRLACQIQHSNLLDQKLIDDVIEPLENLMTEKQTSLMSRIRDCNRRQKRIEGSILRLMKHLSKKSSGKNVHLSKEEEDLRRRLDSMANLVGIGMSGYQSNSLVQRIEHIQNSIRSERPSHDQQATFIIKDRAAFGQLVEGLKQVSLAIEQLEQIVREDYENLSIETF